MTDFEPTQTWTREVSLLEDMLAALGRPLAPGATVLDFGCGEGATVNRLEARGYDAWGCDVVMRSETLPERLRPIQLEPYRLPFDDATFDFIYSEQVFEHVQNTEAAFRELSRVTKPTGAGLHFFPARYTWREGHVYVPLGSVIQSRPWLRLWAQLGIRNEFQQGLGAREVAETNYHYLRDQTLYPTRREFVRYASSSYGDVRYVEDTYIAHTTDGARRLAPLGRVGARLYNGLRGRVMLVAAPRHQVRREQPAGEHGATRMAAR